MLTTLDKKLRLVPPSWFAFVMYMWVTDKTWAVIGQVVLARLAPGYESKALIGPKRERNVVQIEAAACG